MEKLFLLPIEDVFVITGKGIVVTGKIERGIVHVGDEVEIAGLSNKVLKTVIIEIESFAKLHDCAKEGNDVGLLLRGVGKEDVKRGQILCTPGTAQVGRKFYAQAYRNKVVFEEAYYEKKSLNFYFRTIYVSGKVVDKIDNNCYEIELCAPLALEKDLIFAVVVPSVPSDNLPNVIATGTVLELIDG